MGTRDKGSQWCNRLQRTKKGSRGRFCFGKRNGGVKEKEVMRRGSLERNLKAKGRTLVLRLSRHTKRPAPAKHILPDIGLEVT